jgi:hypothetical protein
VDLIATARGLSKMMAASSASRMTRWPRSLSGSCVMCSTRTSAVQFFGIGRAQWLCGAKMVSSICTTKRCLGFDSRLMRLNCCWSFDAGPRFFGAAENVDSFALAVG